MTIFYGTISIMTFLIALATFAFTFLGGLFALRFKDKLHLILGFSAGAVIAVAFFDLIPESIELAGEAYGVSAVTSLAAVGFVAYMILDRFIVMHGHAGDDHDGHAHTSPKRGILGAGSLAIHSFLDGLAIGLAFQVSNAVGAIVTAAVLVHDFSDGINTVNLIVKNGGTRKEAFRWLAVDAIAPVVGVAASQFISLAETSLGVVLAVFAGFFLYIGASDLLPESHHSHPTRWTTVMTILGMAILFATLKIVHI